MLQGKRREGHIMRAFQLIRWSKQSHKHCYNAKSEVLYYLSVRTKYCSAKANMNRVESPQHESHKN